MEAGVETEEKKVAKKGWPNDKYTSDRNVDGGKGDNARCNRCGEVGHNTVRCPRQVCSVSGGKGHSAKVCASVVTAFACEADASGSDRDRVFDEPGK